MGKFSNTKFTLSTPNARAKIFESFYKVWPWNKLKGPVFSGIRLESFVNFFIDKVLQVLYFPGNALLKHKVLQVDFWELYFLILHFQSLGTLSRFLTKSHVGNETMLKKFTEVSTNYGKFICNIIG